MPKTRTWEPPPQMDVIKVRLSALRVGLVWGPVVADPSLTQCGLPAGVACTPVSFLLICRPRNAPSQEATPRARREGRQGQAEV